MVVDGYGHSGRGAAPLGGLAGCGVDARDATRVYFVDGYRSELGMRGRLVAQERQPAYCGIGRVVAEVLRPRSGTSAV